MRPATCGLFDDHLAGRTVLECNGNSDQLTLMRNEVWNPLIAFVNQLFKTTEMPGAPGTSMYDRTTIVLTSEMGRTISGNVDSILSDGSLNTPEKYQAILDQDVCQHWHVNAAAFLGGIVRGGSQFGHPGQTKNPQSFIADAGHVYATALELSGVDPAGKSPPMAFVKRT